jgi:hypothetical protein
MRHFSIWATVAVLSVALFSAPRAGVAAVHQAEADQTVSESSWSPLLEETSIVSNIPVQPSAPAPAIAAEPSATQEEPVAEEAPARVVETSVQAPPAVRVAAAVVNAPAAPRAPDVCPANYFCYARVGIVGPIVPYGDCSAATDVGTAIRSLTCVSPTYLAAHAYTQFGRITGWRAGDVVVVNGARYVLYDAYTQRSCDYPARPLAPLSLQTSLTSSNCGMVLVVQGRPL